MNYIRIPNFENFQAYRDGRRMFWIKLLVEIIDQFDTKGREKKFWKLPDQAKLTFILLLCLQAKYEDKIPFPTEKWLKERLGIERILLKPLIDAGLIISCTDSVQICTDSYSSVPEIEIEIEIEIEKKISEIFKFWNSQQEKGRWKSHLKLTPDIRMAIVANLKTWPVEEIQTAIGNFAMILQGKEYLWTYDRWGLREFLSRRDKDDAKVLRWLRFHPNNFREDDWLTDAARQDRIKKQREQEQRRQAMIKYIEENKGWIMEAQTDVLIEQCKRNPKVAFAVGKLRPEIKIEEAK
jgi:hypothetical protein